MSYGAEIRSKYKEQLTIDYRSETFKEQTSRHLKNHIENQAAQGASQFSVHFHTGANFELARAHRWKMFDLKAKPHIINFLKEADIWYRVWAEHIQIDLARGIN